MASLLVMTIRLSSSVHLSYMKHVVDDITKYRGLKGIQCLLTLAISKHPKSGDFGLLVENKCKITKMYWPKY